MDKINLAQEVKQTLFGDEKNSLFAILDGASVSELLPKLDEFEPPTYCLYPGELDPDMAEVAPYLVELETGTPFSDWVISEGWGKHWGIFVLSPANLRTLRQHFCNLVTVRDYTEKLLRFRYYDPRVLRTYLPICNQEELTMVFGPTSYFLLEDQDPNNILRFSKIEDKLKQEKLKLIDKTLR